MAPDDPSTVPGQSPPLTADDLGCRPFDAIGHLINDARVTVVIHLTPGP